MAYCVNTDVQAEFKDIDITSGTAKISSAKIDEFILQADAYINAKIGLRYIVPVTGTLSLKLLKMLSIWLVASRVSKILQIKNSVVENETGEKSLEDRALEMIDDISKGKLNLEDATLKSSGAGFSSYAQANNLGYTFKKGEDQW